MFLVIGNIGKLILYPDATLMYHMFSHITCRFMATAYIHRKIEEKRKTDRRRTKHKLHSLTSKGPALLEDTPGNPENRIMEEESRPPMKSIMKRRATEIRLEEPISKIMQQVGSQSTNLPTSSKDVYL